MASGSSEEVHALLADVPHEIRIRCDHPPQLARRLIDEGVVESVRFDGEGMLVLGTHRPAAVYSQLPQWVHACGVRVHEVRSTDDSLQALFNSLMRIHRGES